MVTIQVYMQDGRTFHYDVKDSPKAREHAHRIINYGWRNIEDGKFCYYPVHQILKVCWAAEEVGGLENKYFAKPGLTSNQTDNLKS